MNYKYGWKSLSNLEKVHPDLDYLMHKTLEFSPHDIAIVSGMRTLDEQKELLSQKVTHTLNSRHLKQEDGYSHAIDFVPYNENGKACFDDIELFMHVLEVVRWQALELGYKIRLGANWSFVNEMYNVQQQLDEYIRMCGEKGWKVFKDYGHVEIHP